jgi:hypothetical protein
LDLVYVCMCIKRCRNHLQNYSDISYEIFLVAYILRGDTHNIYNCQSVR